MKKKNQELTITFKKKIAIKNKLGNCPCQLPKSHCDITTNICKCDEDYTSSEDNQRCILEKVPIDHPCEFNFQCSKNELNSECLNLSCQCKEGFLQKNGTCYESFVSTTRKFSEKCSSDDFCKNITENSLCLDGKCVCNQNFIFSEGKSVRIIFDLFHISWFGSNLFIKFSGLFSSSQI